LPTGNERTTNHGGRATEICRVDIGREALRPEVPGPDRSHPADGGGGRGGLRDAAAAQQPQDERRRVRPQLPASSEAEAPVEQPGICNC
jgi:hypothetical protein